MAAVANLNVLELYPEDSSCQKDALTNITRRTGKQISYNDFYWNYMNYNTPLLLTGVSNDWECRRNWILPQNIKDIDSETDNNQSQNAINFDYLRHKVGNCLVPIADCSTEYFNSHAKSEMRFFKYLDHWQERINKYSMVYNSNIKDSTTTCTTANLYLKDWHLKAQMPNYDFYQVPKHFASDWLNEHLIATGRDDYRFVYMGPKDSWTSLHADVFGSYSWSTNICGSKKWVLLPPGEELKLGDRLGNLPFSIDEKMLEEKQINFFTIFQNENEALFVPSGWYHQVWNVTDTISVNHNWFNACNLQRIWLNLSTNMKKVIAEIEDCRQMDNFDEHCQTMLRASFGINYFDFLEMLEFIAKRRLSCGYQNGNDNTDKLNVKYTLFNTFQLNDHHILHDLQSINKVLDTMLQDPIICGSRNLLYRRCLQLRELLNGF